MEKVDRPSRSSPKAAHDRTPSQASRTGKHKVTVNVGNSMTSGRRAQGSDSEDDEAHSISQLLEAWRTPMVRDEDDAGSVGDSDSDMAAVLGYNGLVRLVRVRTRPASTVF